MWSRSSGGRRELDIVVSAEVLQHPFWRLIGFSVCPDPSIFFTPNTVVIEPYIKSLY